MVRAKGFGDVGLGVSFGGMDFGEVRWWVFMVGDRDDVFAWPGVAGVLGEEKEICDKDDPRLEVREGVSPLFPDTVLRLAERLPFIGGCSCSVRNEISLLQQYDTKRTSDNRSRLWRDSDRNERLHQA